MTATQTRPGVTLISTADPAVFLAVSRSDPNRRHIVTIDASGMGATCTCPAAQSGQECGHVEAMMEKIVEGNRQMLAVLDARRDRLWQGDALPGESETVSYLMLGLSANRQTPNRTTDALVNFLLSRQERSGQWKLFTQSRPPLESSDFNVTAFSLRALQLYGPQGRRTEIKQRVAEARQWLLNNEARTNEDRTFQLLGLHWSEAPAATIRKLAEPLLAAQRADGGWAQLPGMESDAYATGQALVALHQAGGLPVNDAAYQRGVEYLRRTWQADGSWHVRTRSFPIQKQFASGFPYERDQWISAAATSWAVMALSLTLEPEVQAETGRSGN
mgnify:CR=1 FL=1